MSVIKIAILLSYICIASVAAAIITPALPHIETQYQLGHGAVEWLVSIFLVGYVFGQLIYAPLANRYGRLAALRIGMIIYLLGTGICFYAVHIEQYHMLLLGRLITALGAAAGLSCTFMLIHELLNDKQAKHALSYSTVSFTTGVGVAVLLGGIITQYLHWQDIFWVLIIHGVLMFASTWLFPETLQERKPLHITHLAKSYLHALQSIKLVRYSIIVGYVTVIAYCFSTAAPLITQSQFGLTASEYGYWNLINMAGMFSGGFVAHYFQSRYSRTTTILIGLLVCALGVISLLIMLLSSSHSLIWFFLSTMILYLFSGCIFANASSIASTAIEDKASASSMMSFINMATGTISVVILGYLPTSSFTAFVIMLGVFLGISMILLATNRDLQHKS